MRISDLQPGDVVKDFTDSKQYTFIAAHTPHPLYPQLALVIWWDTAERKWWFDALHPQQELPWTQKIRRPADSDSPGGDALRAVNMRYAELRRVLFTEQGPPRERSRVNEFGPFEWWPR